MGEIVFACLAPHPPVIVPEVGRGREAETAATLEALRRVARRLAEQRPEAVVLITPHGGGRPDAFGVLEAERACGGFARFGAPRLRLEFPVDRALAGAVREEAAGAGLPVEELRAWGADLDWGCTVPLYHLREGIGEAGLVALAAAGLGPREHFEFGRAAARAVERSGRRVALVGSVDLSHALTPEAPAGYSPTGRSFDERYRQAVAEWDREWILTRDERERRLAAEDAIPQTAFVMGALAERGVTPEVLSYEGPFGVGYLVATLEVAPAPCG